LTEKLNSEDTLKQQAEADKKAMAKEWSVKLNETVAQAREQEKTRAQQALERHKAEFTD